MEYYLIFSISLVSENLCNTFTKGDKIPFFLLRNLNEGIYMSTY